MRLFPVLATFLLAGAYGALAQQPDVDCSNPQTQSAMTYCAGVDYQDADEQLNAQWKVTRAAAVAADAEQDKALRGAEQALLKAQRAWIDYRDGTCEVAGFAMRGGSGEPMLVNACLARVTQARLEELKQLATSLAGP